MDDFPIEKDNAEGNLAEKMQEERNFSVLPKKSESDGDTSFPAICPKCKSVAIKIMKIKSKCRFIK